LIQQLGELSENELYLGKFERRLKAPSALDDDLNPVLLVLVTFAKQGGRISLTEERWGAALKKQHDVPIIILVFW
jgi:hypothetical protein